VQNPWLVFEAEEALCVFPWVQILGLCLKLRKPFVRFLGANPRLVFEAEDALCVSPWVQIHGVFEAEEALRAFPLCKFMAYLKLRKLFVRFFGCK
jgi:hypothetical protein